MITYIYCPSELGIELTMQYANNMDSQNYGCDKLC